MLFTVSQAFYRALNPLNNRPWALFTTMSLHKSQFLTVLAWTQGKRASKCMLFSKTRQYALGLIQDNRYLRTGIRIDIDWDGTVSNVS